jgi:hypothetical protein
MPHAYIPGQGSESRVARTCFRSRALTCIQRRDGRPVESGSAPRSWAATPATRRVDPVRVDGSSWPKFGRGRLPQTAVGPLVIVVVRHTSSVAWTSTRLRTNVARRHSGRSRPLNASIRALSPGRRGRLKSSRTDHGADILGQDWVDCVRTVNAARNCLVHRQRVVGPEDIGSEGNLAVRWRRWEPFVQTPTGDFPLVPGYRADEGGKGYTRFKASQCGRGHSNGRIGAFGGRPARLDNLPPAP